ncbi:hypothetical protein DAPPUDRAFT_116880 [Daphnia pulex]|uniref:Retrovirus-related Pol polyprotein from transposon TNT 1-94-like beta-barrel domain-containing protein n=1 Tax=Daphnia pulex TaxID=6669 RepID=E9HQU7_DAPPU|nr:hypothetical protein DAPPUDRAFT_116880 [Daphnia pulex]|eukprot:EFX65875.1 hypothetical protein DAPPUDRAFT_116880 [Daphnia pulex]
MIDIVTGEDILPDEEMDYDGDIENEEEIKEWKVKDCRARGYILSTTEIGQQRILVDCKSAHQMWKNEKLQNMGSKNGLWKRQCLSSPAILIGEGYETRSTGDWFTDSGATQHMTGQREALKNYVAVPEGSWSVTGIGSTNYNVKRLRECKVRISSAKHEVIMVGERAGRGLYLLKIHPRFIHEDHDKQLGFTPPIKTGFQDYQVNFAFASSISPVLRIIFDKQFIEY